jgi:AraC-like DNA-binding protein
MQYVVHAPSPALAPFVERLWALRDAPAHARERIVPTGTLELVINLCEDELRIYTAARCVELSGAVVSGAYQRYFEFDTRAHAAIVGVHFNPGAAGPILGVPPGVLADRHVDLDALWGAQARVLRDQLCEADSTSAQLAILDAALCARIGTAVSHRALDVALARLRRGVRVADVAAELELSRRRLIDVFTAHVGMTPKRWAIVQRFQRAMTVARRTDVSWGQLAIECGYFDQSHLIHDVKELAGVVPAQLVRAASGVKQDHLAVG